MNLEDGLYQVTTSYLCAGFVIQNGVVTDCAPILRNKIEYWKTIAVKQKQNEKENKMPEFKMTVSKDSIKSPEPVDEDLYTFKVEGFKPSKSKNGNSVNYNPIMKIVHGKTTGTKFAGKPIFENLNAGAGWIQHDFVHSLGLELVPEGEGLALPGGFAGDPSKVETWKYSGPIVGKTGECFVIKTTYNNKPQNKIKYYVCKLADCHTKYPDTRHSENLAG